MPTIRCTGLAIAAVLWVASTATLVARQSRLEAEVRAVREEGAQLRRRLLLLGEHETRTQRRRRRRRRGGK